MQRELREIKEKLDVERAGGSKHPWIRSSLDPGWPTAPCSVSRSRLYNSLPVPTSSTTGLPNSYVTSMILGSANFGTTFPGLYTLKGLVAVLL